MKLRLTKIGLALLGNALGLWIASLVLSDDMSVSGTAFLVAVVLFTVLTLIIEPLVAKLAEKYAEALESATTLISTALSLLIAAWISDGLSIDGVGTWVLATVIVWAATLIIRVLASKLIIERMKPA